MYNVSFKRGYYWITGDVEDVYDYKWLTLDEKSGNYYFLPNPTTRKLFSKQMLNDKNMCISDNDLQYLKDFTMSGYLGKYTEEIIAPSLPGDKELKNYQVECVYRMLEHKNYCMFLGPGTGKTLIAITYLNNAHPKSVLVLTPAKVVNQYINEIGKYLDYMPDIEVTNFEQILAKESKYTSKHYDCMIIDESHRLKDYMGKTAKIIREKMDIDHMYLFSGTPMDAGRFDIMSQIALFDKRFVPTKSLFLNRYFNMDEYYRPTSEKLSDELSEMIKLVSCGAETEQLIQLTALNEFVIRCKKPDEYTELFEDKVFIRPDFELICDTPGKLSAKLREICNGFLIDDFGKTIRIESEKIKKLEEILKKNVKQGIIYTMFDEDIEIIRPLLDSMSKNYCVVNGKTKKADADRNIIDFKEGRKDYIVIQAASGKEGLDLLNVNDTIFYSLPPSYITYKQCMHRTRRLGQTKDCNFYYLLCAGTVDTHIKFLLSKKKNFNARLYKMYSIKKEENV